MVGTTENGLDATNATAEWARAVEAGHTQSAHRLLVRLTTSLRLREEGLSALVRCCEEAGASSSLVPALLRQLCASDTNWRGGRHARRYALTVGLRLRWHTLVLDPEAEYVLRYWRERMAQRGLVFAAMGNPTVVDLLTQSRFLLDQLMAPVRTDLKPRYVEVLEAKGLDGHVDDGLCWMLDRAHQQTLWVTARASYAVQAQHLEGTGTPAFLGQVLQEVQSAWAEGVDQFLKRWTTADAQLLALPPDQRYRRPWMSAEAASKLRPRLLAAFQVSDPLEPFTAWQRQRVQNFFHWMVDCVFYGSRVNGVLSVVPAENKVLSIAWSSTPRPADDEVAPELWPDGNVPIGLPQDVQDALWHGTQHYWDYQGEPLADAKGRGPDHHMSAERNHGWLALPWSNQVRGWFEEWRKELPETIQIWHPVVAVLPKAELLRAIPVPPDQCLGTASLTNDTVFETASLEEIVFGREGCALVSDMTLWEQGFSKKARKALPKSTIAYETGLDLAIQQGLSTWAVEALTSRGRALLSRWLLKHSPRALEEPFSYAGRVALESPDDARALAQWLASTAQYEFRNEGFAWVMAELLNPTATTCFSVGRDTLDRVAESCKWPEPLTIQDLVEVGPLLCVQLEDNALWNLPGELGGHDPHAMHAREVHVWSQPRSDGLIDLVIGVHRRSVVDVKEGDSQYNSQVLGDGRRIRYADSFESWRPLPVSAQTTLAELWTQTDSLPYYEGRLPLRCKAVMELVARVNVLSAQELLERRSEDLPLFAATVAPTLESVFFQPAAGVPQAVPEDIVAAVVKGWRLSESDVPLPDSLVRNVSPSTAEQPLVAKPTAEGAPKKEMLELTLQERLHLGQLLRQARATMGLTAVAVASQALSLPTAHAAVCRFERGYLERIPLERLKRLVTFYGLELEEVLAQCRQGVVPWRTTAPQSGMRFRHLREALGLSPSGFVAWLGSDAITAADVERIEKGQVEPLDMVIAAAKAKEASLDVGWLAAL